MTNELTPRARKFWVTVRAAFIMIVKAIDLYIGSDEVVQTTGDNVILTSDTKG